jgi:hypothetical protein
LLQPIPDTFGFYDAFPHGWWASVDFLVRFGNEFKRAPSFDKLNMTCLLKSSHEAQGSFGDNCRPRAADPVEGPRTIPTGTPDLALNPATTDQADLLRQVREICRPEGADAVIEVCGASDVIPRHRDAARRRHLCVGRRGQSEYLGDA